MEGVSIEGQGLVDGRGKEEDWEETRGKTRIKQPI